MSQPLSETHSANGVGQNVTTAAGQHRKKHTKRAQRELPHGAPGPRSPPLPQRGASRPLRGRGRGRGRAGAGRAPCGRPPASHRHPPGSPAQFRFQFPLTALRYRQHRPPSPSECRGGALPAPGPLRRAPAAPPPAQRPHGPAAPRRALPPAAGGGAGARGEGAERRGRQPMGSRSRAPPEAG